MERRNPTAKRNRLKRPRRGWMLVSFVLVALACSTGLLAGAASASAELVPALGTPSPVTTGASVQWRPISFESSYKVAISNDPRSSTQRATRYLTIERAPGEVQSYTPPLAPGETVYVGVSADGGSTWSEQEVAVTAPSSEPKQNPVDDVSSSPPVLAVLLHAVVWNTTPGAASYKVAVSNSARGAAGRVTRYLSIAPIAGEVQFYTPALQAGETVYIGVSADDGSTWSEHEVSITAPGSVAEQAPQPESAPETGPKTAPTPPHESAPKPTPEPTPEPEPEPEPEEPEPTPPPAPAPESGQESTPAPAPEPAPKSSIPVPVLSVKGQTLTWTVVPGATSYELVTITGSASNRERAYRTLTGTSFTPPAVQGQTVGYRVAANVAGTRGPWAPRVSITYPPATSTSGGSESTPAPPVEAPPAPSPPVAPPAPVTPPAPSPPVEAPAPVTPPAEVELPTPSPIASGKIIGTNDGSGWGAAAAKTIIGGHITWDRIELGGSSQAVTNSLSDGFHVLGIVGNLADGTPLSSAEPNAWAAEVVSQLKANPGISIAEAGNEMYYKGKVANPVQYGRMYLAAVEAMKAAGIHTPLLFNMFGDYDNSSDAHGGGWLHDAVAGVPGLAAAIRANGLSSHPYGALNENWDDINGVLAVVGQEVVALSVLGAIPPIYITEFGYSLNNCGEFIGACSQQEQAAKMRAAYTLLLADPHVAGIWWYQSHDDSIGQYGYMNNDNTTRPSFTTLSSIAIEQGQ
jgi:hypothetical protein